MDWIGYLQAYNAHADDEVNIELWKKTNVTVDQI